MLVKFMEYKMFYNVPIALFVIEYFRGKSNFPAPTSISNENEEIGFFDFPIASL